MSFQLGLLKLPSLTIQSEESTLKLTSTTQPFRMPLLLSGKNSCLPLLLAQSLSGEPTETEQLVSLPMESSPTTKDSLLVLLTQQSESTTLMGLTVFICKILDEKSFTLAPLSQVSIPPSR